MAIIIISIALFSSMLSKLEEKTEKESISYNINDEDVENKIKEYIADGVTYEVNYTYPSEVLTNLNGRELFEAILNILSTDLNSESIPKYARSDTVATVPLCQS